MSYPTNTLETTTLISKYALAYFCVNSPLLMTASRGYQPEFSDTGYKIGSTISMRRQNQFEASDGPTISSFNAISETIETLTINHQPKVPIAYSISDLTLRIDDFNRMYLEPAIQNLVVLSETIIAQAAETTLNFFTGSPSDPINSFGTINSAGAQLLAMGVNIGQGAYLNMSIQDANALKNSFINGTVFTPVLNEDIVRTSSIGHISYFDAFQSQVVPTHIAGVGPTTFPSDTLTVNGAVSSGSTIVLQGATATQTNYFLPGDKITIGGVQNLNPLFIPIGGNAQFVITAAANSSGAGAVTITVGTPIITTGNNVNVTNAIPDDAPVTVYGSHVLNTVYTPRSVDVVCPPIARLQVPFFERQTDPDSKLSLAISQSADIMAYENIMRIDTLLGVQWHPQYAAILMSQPNQSF